MKHCSSCNQDKEPDQFGKNIAKKDGLQTTCRACKQPIQNRWYQNNKSRHVANAMKRRRGQETEIIKDIMAYLQDHPCVDCGETNPVVLEFDHVRGTKQNSICNMIRIGYKSSTIFAEIEKCDVRCCKCHRLKTAKQFGYRKLLLASTMDW